MRGGPLTKRVKSLSKMDYDEVSLVDVPANQHALVMITKRHDEGATMTAAAEIYDPETLEPVDEAELETGDRVIDAEGNMFEYTSPEDAEEYEEELVGKADEDHGRPSRGRVATTVAFPGYHGAAAGKKGRKVGAVGSEIGHSLAGSALGATTGAVLTRGRMYPTMAGSYLGGFTGSARAAHTNQRKGRYKDEVRDVTSKSFAEDIAKALGEARSDADRDQVVEEFAKAFEHQEAELQELAEIAKFERDTRLEGEYIEVAKSLGLPGDPDELGPVLKRMSEQMDPADVEVIAKTLDTVSGILFEELGYNGLGPDTGDPEFADAEAAAEARIAKASGDVSKAGAIEEYYLDNPDAYEAYMADRSR